MHVVGPERVAGRWLLLCPICDEDRLALGESSPADRQCTVTWLTGRQLRDEEKFGQRTCDCFESDPYPEEEALDKQRRYFHYRCIALLLGGTGRRVDLPLCVKERVEELYGDSVTGFKGDDRE